MTTTWRLTTHADFGLLGDIVQRLDAAEPEIIQSWSLFDEGEVARLDLLFHAEPDIAAIKALAGFTDTMDIDCGIMPEKDWVRLSLAGLKPVICGRFTLHGEHDRDAVADGQIGMEIEAGLAFGSGHHATTRGCLLAFDELLTKGLNPKTVLDLGCGTAALAIAAAKTLPDAGIIGSDIDPESIDESLENCAKNNTPNIECVLAEGMEHEKVAGRQFELIFCNILAKPLMELAPGIAAALPPGGTAILSGLLTEQVDWVCEPFLAEGLTITRQTPLDEWETLIATKPA
jgi:ribosomal protein L11 methyltransferase